MLWICISVCDSEKLKPDESVSQNHNSCDLAFVWPEQKLI